MKKIEDLREEIDKIDSELLKLFEQRMEVSSQVANYKLENNLPIFDSKREREKIASVVENSADNIKMYVPALYSVVMASSRAYQNKINNKNDDSVLIKKIKKAIEDNEKSFPKSAVVACQGVEGAYSQIACDKMFDIPSIMYISNFEGVFEAVKQGLCRYGVLPLENSTAGSVNKIYDLMMKYNFSIVKSIRLKIDHSVLVKKGVKLEDVREIYSHEQAINQCQEFLSKLDNVKVHIVENTAVAASMVASSDRKDVAALSSHSCASIYGLDCIEQSVQDKGNNYTRFICISKKLEIYPGANKTSIMMVLPHKAGALYKVLTCFNALGINLHKLESRPIPDRDFEFMFYFDLETSIYSEEFIEILRDLDCFCEEYKYLGSYIEVI